MPAVPKATTQFQLFAGAGLVLNILTILWGAYVRASGSGAGCGSHWPLCNGQVIPVATQIHTIIEFTHRLTSGLCLVFAVTLFIWARKIFPKGHLARTASNATLALMIMEALLGASLVLFELVAHDRSAARAVSISLHLVNTLLLLASMTLAFRWARSEEEPAGALSLPKELTPWMIAAFGGTILLGVTGALTALGDTLFKATSLTSGMAQDFASQSHFLLKLRVAHPTLAVAMAVLLFFLAENCLAVLPDSLEVRKWARYLQIAVFTQVAAGALNLLLLAPNWMQLLHLAIADAVWIGLVMLGASVLSSSSTHDEKKMASGNRHPSSNGNGQQSVPALWPSSRP